MSGVSMCGVVWVGEGGLDGYQPGVYVPLKALFLVFYDQALQNIKSRSPINN